MGNEIPKEIGPTKDEKRTLEESGFQKQDNSFSWNRVQYLETGKLYVKLWINTPFMGDKRWCYSICTDEGFVIALGETHTLGNLLWRAGLNTGNSL